MYEARQNKKKTRRQIEKSYKISSQHKSKMALQCTTIDLEANTRIITNKNTYIGKGKNNGGDVASVLRSIGNYVETRWIALLPSPGNPMGACAEPHALSDALQNVKDHERIESILQYPSIASKNEVIGGVHYNKGDVVPGCATCQQWASGIGDNGLENSYVKIPIDRTLEKQERTMKKYGRRNRQLGADFKEENIRTWSYW